MHPLTAAAFVAIGGVIGSLSRWATNETTAAILGRAWTPLGTLFVNIVGCGLIGYIAGRAGTDNAGWLIGNRPLMVTGFCGALTTFSTFGLETVELLRDRPALGAGLVAAHLSLGLGAVWAGMRLAG